MERSAAAIAGIGTYLPPWGTDTSRVAGPDEDAVTMAVAAGRAATSGSPGRIDRVVLVTRDLPLLDGGNAAVVLAGLGLPDDTPVAEQVGGAADALAALADAAPGTLVLAADADASAPAGAAAVLVGETGPTVYGAGRVARSLPVRSRGRDGLVRDYDDPRLMRERGTLLALDRLGLGADTRPDVVAGLPAKLTKAVVAGAPRDLPTLGASSAFFAVAALTGEDGGLVAALEQGSAAALHVPGGIAVHRDERVARPVPRTRATPGPEISISLAAYERAFEAKVRWEAGRCDACGTLALPPRRRCLECGSEDGWSLAPLRRSGEVYSAVTVHVPVPGLPTPYSLAIVELLDADGSAVGVRALVKITGVPAGTTSIGDRGSLVLRRVAVRTGVPDYGYALLPDAEAVEVAA